MPSPDLIHWHRDGAQPSSLRKLPPCCQHVLDRHVDAAIADAHAVAADERRQLVLGITDAVETYRDTVTAVLSGDERELATRLLDHCLTVIGRAACICPDIDASTLDGHSRTVKGFDSQCAAHGAGRG